MTQREWTVTDIHINVCMHIYLTRNCVKAAQKKSKKKKNYYSIASCPSFARYYYVLYVSVSACR